jgi:hypothetical protein
MNLAAAQAIAVGESSLFVRRARCTGQVQPGYLLVEGRVEDSTKLPEPHVLAEEIAEDLRSALEQIESVPADLQQRAATLDA